MTIRLFARGNRATSITTLAVLGVMALLIAPSTPARAADGRPTPVLAQGTGMGARPNAQVRVVQRALGRRGYDLGAPGVDGRFGPLTAAAVRQLQAEHGLPVDGIVGRRTRTALRVPRQAVGLMQAPSHAGHGSKAVLEHTPTSAQDPPGRTTAGIAISRGASMELGYRHGSWSDSLLAGADLLLAGALGGLITLVLAIAVAVSRRHRDRQQGTTTSRPSLVEDVGAGPHDRPERAQTIQLIPNGNRETGVSTIARAVESPPSCLPPGHRLIGYFTTSADSGVSEDDGSAEAIAAMCERSGWELLEIVQDREVGRTLKRPALGYALERIARRQADGLVVSDLHGLSRSIVDLGRLMAWFRNAQAALIALDLGIDTSTPKGRHVASTLITLSNHAHDRIANHGRSDVADLSRDRQTGRPAVRHDPELLERITAMRTANMTLQAIADQLNAERVPTLRGGERWRPSSIQAALGYRRPRGGDHLPPLDHRSTRPSTPAATAHPRGGS
jgi:DNA invertase Pin-like site-specific DNA recombinase/peptidoglycan hydrolase-like protein with peptidoglycan-binding domain